MQRHADEEKFGRVGKLETSDGAEKWVASAVAPKILAGRTGQESGSTSFGLLDKAAILCIRRFGSGDRLWWGERYAKRILRC